MKTAIILPILFLMSVAAPTWADDAKPTFHVQQVDKDFPVEQFAAPGIQVHKADEDKPGAWNLPQVEARDKAFSQAGLTDDLKSWDQLDRDMLFLRARESGENGLVETYPKLSKKKLRALANFLKESP